MNAISPTNAGIARKHRGIWFWVKRGLLGLLLFLIALPLTGLAFNAVASENDRRNYPPPGQLVDIGGYSLHLYCTGTGSPTVILDAGGGFTLSSWAWVQPEIAKATQVCSYDRAGWGWSDPSPKGYSAIQNAAELHLLLNKAGVVGPYILVGHSLGGLYTRVYAQQYPEDVAGLVQVDASHPDAWRRLGNREGAGADPQMIAMAPIAAQFGLLRMISFVPIDPELPERQQGEMRAFFASSKFATSVDQFDMAFPEILQQARGITSVGNIPLVVLTTGEVDGGLTEESRILRDMQHELAQLSENSLYLVVEGASHTSLVHNRAHAQSVFDVVIRVIAAVQSGELLSNFEK